MVQAGIFNKAAPRTLRTEVVDMLRDAIVRGHLKPGDHLKENEIAAQMSVSRSPVREAFRQLEQEGLIESFPNQGCYVKTFSAKEIEDIFTLRAVLENLAFELIITGGGFQPGDWQQIEDLIAQQKTAIQEKRFNQLTNLDMDFHEFFCEKSGSKHLLQMWRSLRGQIQILFYQRFQTLGDVPGTVDADHHDMIEILREGDLEKIKRMNREVNARVAQDCIKVFGLDTDN
jgi:DNA-binding GntR family transcriptional regulator